MAVVNNLKTIRESRGLLQEDIASATGFCAKTISRVERGEHTYNHSLYLDYLYRQILYH